MCSSSPRTYLRACPTPDPSSVLPKLEAGAITIAATATATTTTTAASRPPAAVAAAAATATSTATGTTTTTTSTATTTTATTPETRTPLLAASSAASSRRLSPHPITQPALPVAPASPSPPPSPVSLPPPASSPRSSQIQIPKEAAPPAPHQALAPSLAHNYSGGRPPPPSSPIMPRRKPSTSSAEPPAKRGPIWATPCRPCAGRMIKNPGHLCRGQGEKSAKCAHCVAGHHKCEDLLVDKDGKIKPAARAVAAASLKVSRGEEVPDYETLATRYNLLARREAKRRAPSASGGPAAAVVSSEALAGLMRRQNEILLDIRAELSAMRERAGAGTPPAVDSEDHEDDFGFDGQEEDDD